MKIVLKQLKLVNFKGIKDITIDFGNKSTKIFGKNGAGKTTVSDAMNWLLFGKNTDGNAKFDVRPKDKDGNLIHFIDIVVSGVFEIDGKEITIEKTQSEKWVKKRGSEEKTYEGNKNEYVVNTIPKSESDYKKWINELIQEDVFKAVSNLNDFMGKDTKERRKKLFEFVSSITDKDVANTDDRFKPLRDDMVDNKFTIEEITSRTKLALKKLKEKLDGISPRIDEVTKSKSDIDVAEVELQVNALKEQIEEIEKKEADVNSQMQEFNMISDTVMDLKMGQSEIERLFYDNYNKEARKNSDDKADAEHALRGAKLEVNNAEYNVKECARKLLFEKQSLDNKKQEYISTKKLEFDVSSLNCPTCGQSYPKEKQDELKAKFEADRKEKLLKITKDGNTLSETVKETEERLAELKSSLEEATRKLNEATESFNKVNSISVGERPNISTCEQYVEYQNKIDELLAKQSSMNTVASTRQELQIKRKGLYEELSMCEKKIASADNADKDNRIEELKAEQKTLSQQIADQEKIAFLIEEFERKKATLFTEKINEHFKIVKWKLFENQINGGYAQVCDATVNGQSYFNGLNAGHKILAELDIISALQKIYGVSTPVFIDNAERLSSDTLDTVELDCQVISLCVSNDKELKVEV